MPRRKPTTTPTDSICNGAPFSAAYGQPSPECPIGGGACVFTGNQEFKWVPHLEMAIIEPLTFIPWVPSDLQQLHALSTSRRAPAIRRPTSQHFRRRWVCCHHWRQQSQQSVQRRAEDGSVLGKPYRARYRQAVLEQGRLCGRPTSATATGTTSSAPIITPLSSAFWLRTPRSKAPLSSARPTTSRTDLGSSDLMDMPGLAPGMFVFAG